MRCVEGFASVLIAAWWALLKRVWSLRMFVWISQNHVYDSSLLFLWEYAHQSKYLSNVTRQRTRHCFKHEMQWMGTGKYWCDAYCWLHWSDFTGESEEIFHPCSCRNQWTFCSTISLRLGWTLCPASINVNPWLTTWDKQCCSNHFWYICSLSSSSTPSSRSTSTSSSYCKVAFHFLLKSGKLTCGLFIVLTPDWWVCS